MKIPSFPLSLLFEHGLNNKLGQPTTGKAGIFIIHTMNNT